MSTELALLPLHTHCLQVKILCFHNSILDHRSCCFLIYYMASFAKKLLQETDVFSKLRKTFITIVNNTRADPKARYNSNNRESFSTFLQVLTSVDTLSCMFLIIFSMKHFLYCFFLTVILELRGVKDSKWCTTNHGYYYGFKSPTKPHLHPHFSRSNR